MRVPSHPVAQALLAAFAAIGGEGIAAPSANRFGHVSPTTATHVEADLDGEVAMILDGGACEVGIESTIVAFAHGRPLLLRPGAIGIDDADTRASHASRAPPMRTRHAPPERSLRITRRARRRFSCQRT